jgi:AcrR family transcriptional regulator
MSPDEVERHQRERMLGAIARGMAEGGYAALTVGAIIAEARVSRTTFYAQFANKQEAVLGAFEESLGSFLARVEGACAAEEEWPAKLKRGIEATVGFAAEQPAMALLLAAQCDVADRTIGEQMLAGRRRLLELLRPGRRHPGASTLPEITEEALVGAVSAVLSRALSAGDLDDPEALRPQLTEFALSFYLGPAAAAKTTTA